VPRTALALDNQWHGLARRIGPFYGKLVASPDYFKAHGAPETPSELLSHQALMQGTETWQFIDGSKTIAVHPQGRFKGDNGAALAAAAAAGLGIAWLPDCVIEGYLASGALVPVMTRYPPPRPVFLLSGRRDSTLRERSVSSQNC
jgi:DNA-binding transcriptional LysR family regulator